MAFTLTILMMLLVGVVTAAVALGRDNSIQNAAREASRFGATLPDVDSNLSEVRDVAQAAASGDLDPSVPGYYICVAIVDGTNNTRLVDGSPPPPLPPDDSCFDDGRPNGERRVQVLAGRDVTINAVLFSTDVTVGAEAAARYER